ncbi:TPA: hypothetical protein QDB04_002260 [Burkholderia vietnamiensis]|nr:hypothetical protein [Burkholderia vietnamiensis]
MFLLSHEDEAAAEASAVLLKGMGGAARRLLAECVEHTQLTRKTLSAAAKALESAGFIFVRDESTIWDEAFVLSAALAGEEALEMLEQREAERSTKATLTGQT